MKKRILNIIMCSIIIALVTNCKSKTKENKSTKEESMKILSDAYLYGYPLMMMEATKRVRTNTNLPTKKGVAPVNQFGSIGGYPDATFTDVVRPNVDTYYSMLWFDLKKEPMVVQIPETKHYYLMPIIDAYTNVIGSPGSRTTGQKKYEFVVVGPNYKGKLPKGMPIYQSTTNIAWLIGRIRANNKEEQEDIRSNFQKRLKTFPLSQIKNKKYVAPEGDINSENNIIPMDYIDNLSTEDYFNELMALMVDNPPYDYDSIIIKKMASIGIVPGGTFNTEQFNLGTKAKLKMIPRAVHKKFKNRSNSTDTSLLTNGWMFITEGLGKYNTNYALRAYIAYIGLGANEGVDAIYPNTSLDSDNDFLNSKNNYILHFDADKTPPVKGFWSLTMYNKKGFLVDNKFNKYAIEQSDNLYFNEDGSLDIYIQKEAPEGEKARNWLPSANDNQEFELTMRMYWPKEDVLNHSWIIPKVEKQ